MMDVKKVTEQIVAADPAERIMLFQTLGAELSMLMDEEEEEDTGFQWDALTAVFFDIESEDRAELIDFAHFLYARKHLGDDES